MKYFVVVKNGIARRMEAQNYVTDAMAEVAKWAPDDQAQVTSARPINDTDFPTSRSVALRDAWEDDGAKITVNMVKARANKISYEVRPERDRRLTALDVTYMRADEAGNTAEKARIASVKQRLRDLPATIQPDLDAIATPEALEAYQPTWPV